MSRWSHLPFLVVVSAPSGTGKTTLCRRVLERVDGIRFSISHTTRPRREGEVDGVDYHFVDVETFQRMVAEGRFLEYAEVYGNYYGTSIDEIERAHRDGVDLLVEIDVQGALQIMERRPDAVTVFVLPPSLETLERRLRGRGTDSEAEIARRLRVSKGELATAPRYEYWIVNDNLEEAVDRLRSVILAERSRRQRLPVDRSPWAELVP